MTQQEQTFWALLKTEAQCVTRLVDALKEEKANLRKLDAVKITASAQQKIVLIKALQQTSAQCITWLKNSSSSTITLTVREYIKTLFPKNQPMLALLDEIKTLASECQRLNDINGGVIALSQQYNQRALAILHGDTPGANLYGKEGKTRQNYSPKTLGKV